MEMADGHEGLLRPAIVVLDEKREGEVHEGSGRRAREPNYDAALNAL